MNSPKNCNNFKNNGIYDHHNEKAKKQSSSFDFTWKLLTDEI